MRNLNSYPVQHIDIQTERFFRQSVRTPDRHKSDNANILVNLLDCYLGLTRQTLPYASLFKTKSREVLAGFVGAIWSNAFLCASRVTRGSYDRAFRIALRTMSKDIPNLSFDIDAKSARKIWANLTICELQREYYDGWPINGKSGSARRNLKLAWVWNMLGPDVARKIHKSASDYVQGYRTKSIGNFAPVLNELLAFIESEYAQPQGVERQNPLFTTHLIDRFCKSFFDKKLHGKRCIETSIKRWNDAIGFLDAVLVGSKVFAQPYRSFPYIPPARKLGSESKVVVNDKGAVVKDNLILEIPLETADDQVIELMFQRLNEDVEYVLRWARMQAADIHQRCSENQGVFDCMDFGLPSKRIAAKYGVRVKKGEKVTDLAHRIGLPTAYSLEPFVYLLIEESPKITEAFLLQLEFFDKRGKLVGLERSDAGCFLVGYKRRCGGRRAQQKIRLTESGLSLVNQIIEITAPLRRHLESKRDPNSRYLFLSCRRGFSYPTRVSESLRVHNMSRALNNRIAQFVDASCDGGRTDEQVQNRLTALVCRLTPTRFRATCGIQVFLETGSARAMSDALGHAKYNPELLEHYLPEPILRFFQARWVRIFQKGIVCEAMKDSPLLLRASNFRTMDELDQFLSTHALALPAESDSCEPSTQTARDQAYISVDSNILTALLSIQLAVEESERRVSPKAHYWSRFAVCIQTEITENSFDESMISALETARKQASASLMGHLVHA